MTSLLDTRRVFLVIVALGLFAMAARSVTDPDVWWHLRTGQLILQNHAVFRSDPYSFTKFGQPWVNHEWLSDALIFTLFRTTGWAGPIVTFAGVTSAAFMLVFLRCAGRPYLAAAFTVWSAIASAPSWGVRPQTLSLLLASLFLLLLNRSYECPNVLWYTLPLMLLWVNLHAGFAIGIAFMVVFLVGDFLGIAFGFEEWSQSRGRVKKLAAALAACLVVVPLNPYGVQMYRYPFQTVDSSAMQTYIAEWFSPNFHQGMYTPVLLLMLAIFVAATISPRRLRPRELLLLSITTWAALHSARHIPIYALVAAPILSNLVYAWTREQNRLKAETKRPSTTLVRQMFNGVALAAFLILGSLKVRNVLSTQTDVERHSFPVAAVSFLQAGQFSPQLFNNYNWGGYLIWKLYPEYRVCIDGRADLYGDKVMGQFASAYNISDPSWRPTLEKWQIETVILPPDAPLASALRLRPSWNQVYSDRQAVVLRRPQAQTGQ
jgi:hypothetical protein